MIETSYVRVFSVLICLIPWLPEPQIDKLAAEGEMKTARNPHTRLSFSVSFLLCMGVRLFMHQISFRRPIINTQNFMGSYPLVPCRDYVPSLLPRDYPNPTKLTEGSISPSACCLFKTNIDS